MLLTESTSPAIHSVWLARYFSFNRWERQLNRLAAATLPISPPPAVWKALEQRLLAPSVN